MKAERNVRMCRLAGRSKIDSEYETCQDRLGARSTSMKQSRMIGTRSHRRDIMSWTPALYRHARVDPVQQETYTSHTVIDIVTFTLTSRPSHRNQVILQRPPIPTLAITATHPMPTIVRRLDLPTVLTPSACLISR